MQSALPGLSVIAFAIIVVVGFKLLPAGGDEFPARRVALFLLAAAVLAFGLFLALSLLRSFGSASWYRNGPLLIAFMAFAFIAYRNLVRKSKKE
jgi:hypothetical protein